MPTSHHEDTKNTKRHKERLEEREELNGNLPTLTAKDMNPTKKHEEKQTGDSNKVCVHWSTRPSVHPTMPHPLFFFVPSWRFNRLRKRPSVTHRKG